MTRKNKQVQLEGVSPRGVGRGGLDGALRKLGITRKELDKRVRGKISGRTREELKKKGMCPELWK